MIGLRIRCQFARFFAEQGDLVVRGNPRPRSLEFLDNRSILDVVERLHGQDQCAFEVGRATDIQISARDRIALTVPVDDDRDRPRQGNPNRHWPHQRLR